jgi:hemin uptake protein HemP
MSTIRRDESVPAAKAGERHLTLHRDVTGAWATTSEALLGSEGRLTIRHAGECYQLRLTRQNRLILTK